MGGRRGRFLEATLEDPCTNLALEEVLFKGLRIPTLRVWANQRSVVIGRGQLAKAETDLEYCRRRSIPVVRRFTAGGAVYNGPGNLNWSFFVPMSEEEGVGGGPWRTISWDPGRVFDSFASIVVEALGECGVKSEHRPPNSIFDSRGKISGMAAYISKVGVLCHGTLLVDADLEEVQALTTPSAEMLSPRYPRSKKVVVSNCGVAPQDFVSKLSTCFSRRTGDSYDVYDNDGEGDDSVGHDSLTAGELEAACSLASAKYASESWNLGDPFSLDYA